MSQAANITVKKADGTTDIVYTVVTPSAGDGSPAVFRSNAVGSSVAQRPTLTVTPRGKIGRRVIKTNFVYPITDATGKVTDYITIVAESNIPDTAPDTVVSEAVHQGSNLNASALIKGTRVDGFGPN